ncbi:hypothetical protein SB384_17335 [Burkholderia cenocepacia]|uniref:hypothetical protein n=1 Tax=Burkholderia cenocepacia TaxID=95486 RepID=UPI002B253C47|nr:hypothetical protein [Burkholderia cenocepacia]MEB2601406.1 hypothetical protein [Burkholderia cenocepacia]
MARGSQLGCAARSRTASAGSGSRDAARRNTDPISTVVALTADDLAAIEMALQQIRIVAERYPAHFGCASIANRKSTADRARIGQENQGQSSRRLKFAFPRID